MVPLAAFAVFVLARLTLGPGAREREPDPQAAARSFVEDRIDRHIERLTRAWLQPGAHSAEDAGTAPAFASEIESFIGNVVLWDALSTLKDDALSAAVRELVVLDRPWIDARILARVKAPR